MKILSNKEYNKLKENETVNDRIRIELMRANYRLNEYENAAKGECVPSSSCIACSNYINVSRMMGVDSGWTHGNCLLKVTCPHFRRNDENDH